MKAMTRREVLRRSTIPLVLAAGGGGVVAAARATIGARTGDTIVFGSVTDATESSVTVTPDDGTAVEAPLSAPDSSRVRQQGNPFKVGDRVVIELDANGQVVGIEAFTDLVTGTVSNHRHNRLKVDGNALAVDGWSLARVGHEQDARVVDLQSISLAAGTQVGVLVRRGRSGAKPRVSAVFVDAESR